MIKRCCLSYLCSLLFILSFAQTPELLLQTGHRSTIFDIAVSKDGKWMATAGRDKIVILWDFASGKQIKTFAGHEGYINAIAFSPNNLEIASASDDGTVRIWSLSSDKAKIISAVQDEPVRTISYNNSGDKLVTSSAKAFKVWNAANVTVLMNIERTIGNNAEFNPDDVSIVSNRWDYKRSSNFLSVYDAGSGAKTFDFQTAFVIENFHVSGDGKFLMLRGSSNTVAMWNLQNKKELWKIEDGDFSGLRCSISFAPGNKYVAYSINDKVRVYEVLTGKLISELAVKDVSAIEFSGDGNYLITGTRDPHLTIWDFRKGIAEREIKMEAPYVLSATFNYDGSAVYISARPEYKAWDLKTNQVQKLVEGNMLNVAVGVSKSGRYLAYNQNDSTSIIETASQKKIYTFQPNQRSIADFKLIFTPDEQYLLTASSHMELWNINSRAKSSFNEEDGITAALSNDAKWIAKGSNGNTNYISVWDFSTHAKKYVINGISPLDIKFSADGKYMAACDLYNKVCIWESQTGKLIKSFQAANIIGNLDFSSDGLYLAGAGEDNTITLWNTTDWNIYAILRGHTAAVKSVAFSPDGKTIVSAGDDATVRLWDVKSGKVKAILFLTDKNNYIIFNDKNYYTTTKGALQNVAFNIDNKVFPFEQFDIRLNRPDLVLASLQRADAATVELYHKAYEKRLRKLNISPGASDAGYHVPTLILKNEKIPFSTNDKIFHVAVSANDDKYKLDRLNIFVNEVPLYGKNGLSLQSQNKNKIEKDLEIELTKGKNKIQLSVMNEKGAESLYQTFYINYEGSTGNMAKPDLYILAIGVSDYDDDNYDLAYAAKDATDFINLLTSKKGQFGKISVIKYLDKEATKENILKAKEVLNKTNPGDYVIAFVAGHGLLDEKLDYYFATSNTDFSHPALRSLNYDDLEGLFDGIPARKKILLIDACNSGEVDKENVKAGTDTVHYPQGIKSRGVIAYEQTTSGNTYNLMQVLFADLNRGTGAIVISSASGLEFAYESKEYKNGVFTYALLEGLSTLNADLNGNKVIAISELKDYIFKRVADLTNGKQHPTSRKENLEFDFDVW